ncbi:Hypothetical protein SMAX5B_016300, partial [Scophthalmus maximus]
MAGKVHGSGWGAGDGVVAAGLGDGFGARGLVEKFLIGSSHTSAWPWRRSDISHSTP